MLNRQTYTPALEAEAAPILTTLPEAVAVQLVREMIRLGRSRTAPRENCRDIGRALTAAKDQMSYFTRASVSRPMMGRPLGQPVTTFTALLYARLSGHSRKRAAEILTTDPDKASGAIWSIAAQAATAGVQTAEQFQQWLQREEQPSQQ